MSIVFAQVIAALMQSGGAPAVYVPAPLPLAEAASCLCCEKGSRQAERHRVRAVGPRARVRRGVPRAAAADRARLRERIGRGVAVPRALSDRADRGPAVRAFRSRRPSVPGSDAGSKIVPRASLRDLLAEPLHRPAQTLRKWFTQLERRAPRDAHRGPLPSREPRRGVRLRETGPAASFLTWRAGQDQPDQPQTEMPPEPSRPELAPPDAPDNSLVRRGGRGRASSAERRWEALRRRIAERRPELAERIEELLRRSPDRFEELLAEALLSRIGERPGPGTFLRPRGEVGVPRAPRVDSARPPTPSEPRSWRARTRARGGDVPPERGPAENPLWWRGRGTRAPMPPDVSGPDDSLEPLLRKFFERHEGLEKDSRVAVRKLRAALRARKGGDEQSDELRARLEQIIGKQFDTRTEMRHIELERIESQLRRLQESLERLRREFERRQSERGTIVERRIRELAGEGDGGR